MGPSDFQQKSGYGVRPLGTPERASVWLPGAHELAPSRLSIRQHGLEVQDTIVRQVTQRMTACIPRLAAEAVT